MCNWGTYVKVKVNIPARLSHTGKDRNDFKFIDSCIADLVNALNIGGVKTLQSCCGHKTGNGRIDLQDGRILFVNGKKK